MNTRIIMFIDDDPISNFVGSRTLEHFKLADEVVSCMSGIEGLDYLNEVNSMAELPDLIFLDLNMPEMNGWEFLEEYRTIKHRLPKDIKIVILTSSDYVEDIKKARSYEEVADYITKPLKLEDLQEIKEYLYQ